jgi:hypothetical protein
LQNWLKAIQNGKEIKMSAIDEMPDDLKCLANFEWDLRFDRVCWDFKNNCPEWFNSEYFEGKRGYNKSEHKSARQQLGLEPASVPEGVAGEPRTAEAFLHEAAELMTERGKQYDQEGGERSMGKTVKAFNAITGKDLTESEGWLLMSLLKRVRQHSGAGYHKDSAEDAVAYAALEAESLEAQK